MAQSIELQAKIQAWRQKSAQGTMTQEDMREAIAALRQDRVVAHTTSTASKARKSAAKEPVNVGGLFDELDKL